MKGHHQDRQSRASLPTLQRCWREKSLRKLEAPRLLPSGPRTPVRRKTWGVNKLVYAWAIAERVRLLVHKEFIQSYLASFARSPCEALQAQDPAEWCPWGSHPLLFFQLRSSCCPSLPDQSEKGWSLRIPVPCPPRGRPFLSNQLLLCLRKPISHLLFLRTKDWYIVLRLLRSPRPHRLSPSQKGLCPNTLCPCSLTSDREGKRPKGGLLPCPTCYRHPRWVCSWDLANCTSLSAPWPCPLLSFSSFTPVCLEHWWVCHRPSLLRAQEKDEILSSFEVIDYSSSQCPVSSSWVRKKLGKIWHGICNIWSCPGSELHQTSDDLAVQMRIEFFHLSGWIMYMVSFRFPYKKAVSMSSW